MFVQFKIVSVNTALLPTYLNKHLMIIINSHESWAMQYITYKSNWNIAHCRYIPFILLLNDWYSQARISLSTFTFFFFLFLWFWKHWLVDISNQYLYLRLTNIKFFQFLTQFLWRKKDTDFNRNFSCHKNSLLDYHQTNPLHPQLQHFWSSFHLRKLFPNCQHSFLPSARSGGISEFMQVSFFLLLFHGPSRDSLVLLKSFLFTGFYERSSTLVLTDNVNCH